MEPVETLANALAELNNSQCSADDRIAQYLDLAALALEHARTDHAKDSFGGHEDYFDRTSARPQIAGALRALRGARQAINLRSPTPDQLASLATAVSGVVEATGAATAPYLRRVSYDARVVNALSLETRHGHRLFHLVHGSALSPRADVLVVSSHANRRQPLQGQLISALAWRWGLELQDSGPLLTLPGGGWASWISNVPEDAPFRNVLLLRTPTDQTVVPDLRGFASHIQGLFAALAAASYLGQPVKTVTLPMVSGNRIGDVDGRAAVMLREVTRWLQIVEAAELVQAVVFFADELAAWDSAMNRVLGRTFVGPGQDAVLDGLHKDVLSRLPTLRTGPLATSIQSLFDELRRVDGALGVHSVCVFGRKLVEDMVAELLRRRDLKPHHELMRNIEELHKLRAISPWVASYMHGLRILGNESVHSRDSDVPFSPSTLGRADLAQALAAIRALLDAWKI